MSFGRYIGGVLLCILAVPLTFIGIVVLLGFLTIIPASLNIPVGIALLIMALLMFLYGWYSYKSAKPKGTMNVHNV